MNMKEKNNEIKNNNTTLDEYHGFKIDEEIDSLFSNLNEWEYTALKKDIIQYGIRNPLIVTNDNIVICGHQRLRIAKDLRLPKDQIPFTTMNFDNRKQLMDFAVKDNLLRRQLNDFQKGVIALKLLPYYEKSAKIRQKSGTSVNDLTKGRSLDKVGEEVGLSHVTLHKIRYIINNANTEKINDLSNGDISISKCYQELKSVEKVIVDSKLDMVDYNDLEFNEYNPNVMSKETMDILKKSIEIYGFVKPIVTTKRKGKYFVIDGEKRAKAMKELGKTEIPTIVLKNCPESKAQLGSITLNRLKPSTNRIKRSKLLKELTDNYPHETLKKYIPFIDSIND